MSLKPQKQAISFRYRHHTEFGLGESGADIVDFDRERGKAIAVVGARRDGTILTETENSVGDSLRVFLLELSSEQLRGKAAQRLAVLAHHVKPENRVSH